MYVDDTGSCETSSWAASQCHAPRWPRLRRASLLLTSRRSISCNQCELRLRRQGFEGPHIHFPRSRSSRSLPSRCRALPKCATVASIARQNVSSDRPDSAEESAPLTSACKNVRALWLSVIISVTGRTLGWSSSKKNDAGASVSPRRFSWSEFGHPWEVTAHSMCPLCSEP